MADLTKRTEMALLDADIRKTSFDEVALGYTESEAIAEAKRCLNCKNHPCVGGCPVGISIPEFIAYVANGDFASAYEVLSESTSLPAVCGRVCPQESQCEKYCVRGIKGDAVAIGRLERFVADWNRKNNKNKVSKPLPNGHKVAVVGSGPSGLACASHLAKMGYDVTVYEALHIPGGVLSYGIPEFRLPKSIVKYEIDALCALGVKIETNVIIGKTVLIDELFSDFGYEAVFIGSGAGLPKFMKIPGESLKGVFSANEFLTRINLMGANRLSSDTPIFRPKKCVVVGGGNVAMDAARCAKRLGADVKIVYRRTKAELPARLEEVEHAEQEGIEFLLLTNPVMINGDENGFVRSIVCRKMKLGEPDASGRASPYEIENSDFSIDADAVIMALGTSPNPLIASTTDGLETEKFGGICTDEVGKTSKDNVFAGGDAVTGAATVILAMGAGKKAAAEIDRVLNSK